MIKNGKVVDLSYSLKSSDGKLLDFADSKAPFTYLHGAHQIVPGLENALEGLNIGDKKQVTVDPEEGYGTYNPKLKLVVNRTQFPDDMEIEPGMQFEVETEDGEALVFTVEGNEGDKVQVDGNHPLAGQTLHFDVEVLKIRDATSEELEHGHAHGAEGHDHDHDHDDEEDHQH
jgi:FKBP-type peptidyl-prolyl cis-trans isomerase SlyD